MFVNMVTPLVPVAFAILLGYVAGFRVFGVSERKSFAKLILDWLLSPLFIFGNSQNTTSRTVELQNTADFSHRAQVPYLAALLVYRFPLRYNQSTATIRASLLAFPDMVFMGIPILGKSFPDSGHEARSYAHHHPSL
jgi:predicted permease